MKFSIKDYFSKCDQIHRKMRIWSYLVIFTEQNFNQKLYFLYSVFLN